VEGRKFFIISSSKSWAESVKRYASDIHNADVHIIEIPEIPDEVPIPILDLFNLISSKLEKRENTVLRNSIAIFDIGLYEWNLNPLSITSPERNQLASMLTLAFPEIHWVFVRMIKKEFEGTDDLEKKYTFYWTGKLKEFFDSLNNLPSPFFDPSNLRNSIRENMKRTADLEKQLKYLQLHDRGDSASIDEEEPYACLHGYLAYKLGYRCFLVTTMRMIKEVFGKETSPERENKPNNIDLVFEDMFLNFPDRERYLADKKEHLRLSDLRQRDRIFDCLKNVENRIFVTVGHKYIPTERLESNKVYIEELKAGGKRIKKVYKPSGGIYNILEKAGLLKKYWKRKKEEWDAAIPFVETAAEEGGGHSAPGRLLVIAEKLIDRAERIFDGTQTVQGCIHGALLALEAQELLGYRTPTTSLEAIALRHQLEVKAECMFYGVGYNIDMKKRFKEIAGEVKAVSRWFHPSVKKKSALNAQMGIITELMEILREYFQFDEEQECLKCFRKLNRKWYFSNRPWLNFIRPIRWYIETLVGSFSLLITSIIGWPLLSGVVKFILDKYENFGQHILQAYMTFFSFQPIESEVTSQKGQQLASELASKITYPGYFPHDHWLTLLLIIGGFLHLGIFISYLYTVITRK